MSQNITVSDSEPAHEWIGALAHEAPEGQLIPDKYEFAEVRRLVLQFAEQFKPSGQGELSERYERLLEDTTLSQREAEVVAMKELGMTHGAIAMYYAVLDEGTTGDDGYPTSASTVDEYSLRAKRKYETAWTTVEELKETYGR